MQHSQRDFTASNALPNDELDNLFKQLHQIQPPESLIERILTTVLHLPRPALPAPPEALLEVVNLPDTLDSPIVRNDKLPPS